MRRRDSLFAIFSLFVFPACSGPAHGPYWENEKVTPPFTVQQDSVSTTFSGHVYPQTEFVLGPSDGVSFTTAHAKLTIDASAVWAQAPITVEFFASDEGGFETDEHLIARWSVEPPATDGSLQFEQSQALEQTPGWVRVVFPDFAGQCVLQVLGHH